MLCGQEYDDNGLVANMLLFVMALTAVGTCGCWSAFKGVVKLEVRLRRPLACAARRRLNCCSMRVHVARHGHCGHLQGIPIDNYVGS